MSKYLVFRYVLGSVQDGEGYPGGGWHDFIGAFDTIEQCRTAAETVPFLLYDGEQTNYAHIVDLETQAIVLEGSYEFTVVDYYKRDSDRFTWTWAEPEKL